MTRKLSSIIGIVLLLGCLALPAMAEEQAPEFTGILWLQSLQSEKQAVLYGASSVVAVEKALAEREGRKASPFVEGWMQAFSTTSLPQLQEKLDEWYLTHPDGRVRLVFDVLWYEFMLPALEKTGQNGQNKQ